MAVTVVAAYDIRDDGRRARLAALLQSCGDRVQFSVFLLSLPEEDLSELVDRATGIMDVDRDSLVFFRQCRNCWDAMEQVGQVVTGDAPLAWMVF